MPYTSDCLLGETLDSLIMCICLVCQTMETSFLQHKNYFVICIYNGTQCIYYWLMHGLKNLGWQETHLYSIR
jgi:hypothetical protein